MKYILPYSPGFQRIITESSGCESSGFTRPYVPRKILEVSSVEYSKVQVSTPQSSHLLILSRSLQFQLEVSPAFSMLTQDLVSRTSVEECVSMELEYQHSLYPISQQQ